MVKKIAVVLMNLGGPDTLQSVKPFLYNLFADKAIINLPSPLRQLVAKIISTSRNKKAQKIYEQLGGGSPLLGNTQAQAQALETELKKQNPDKDIKVFIAMRYWHPMTAETVEQVADFDPDKVILLPLYPQYSTTTSASSLKIWENLWQKKGKVKCETICCYPNDPLFIQAQQELLQQELLKVPAGISVRILFSAHGLPQKIVDAGDPYQFQVEKTVQLIAENLSLSDYVVCYQSRVGPLKWLQPNLEDEVRQAAEKKMGIIIVPISFVSEHSETLVELDIDYREKAKSLEIPYYGRVPTLSCNEIFIASLSQLVDNKLNQVKSFQICPPEYKNCWCRL